MFLIAGLGNPGDEYARSRHNVGFRMIDRVASENSAEFRKKRFFGITADAVISGTKCMLLKPLTYMNSSGDSIGKAARFYGIPPQHVIVICDDINLKPGIIRIKNSGSSGGHNGLKSIIAALGSDQFPRIRVGVGEKPDPRYPLADWVLAAPSAADASKIESRGTDVCDSVRLIVEGKIEEAQNLYNKK
jgi:PTH1 family peptidyl-tRNA hydrolase